jgi:hypothetical protein
MKKLLTVAAIAAALPGSVLAHHGHNNSFDVSKPVDVSGVITKLRFVNPHSYVYFDVTTESGEVENWYCEMRAANVMKRSGWTADMFEPGMPIRVEGIASRKSATGCYVETVTLGDEVLNRYEQIEENKHEVVVDRASTTAWGDPNIAGDWAAKQLLADTSTQPSYAGGPPGRGGDAGGPPGGGRDGAAGGPPPGGGRGGRGGASIELTDAGTKAMAELMKEREKIGANVAGRLDCKPRNLFSDWTFDQHTNRIEQEEDTIIFRYGFMDTVRTIHMDMKEHPANIEPSFTGHSIGSWEDDVLVIDTVGFPSELLIQGPSVAGVTSDEFHVVERLTVDEEKGELTIAYTADDPKYWKEGQSQSGSSTVYVSDLAWEMYNCEDLTEE